MNRIPITDLQMPELAIYAQLNEVQLLRYDEPKEGLFIAESLYCIERALEAGYRPQSVLVQDRRLKEERVQKLLKRLADAVPEPPIPLYVGTEQQLGELTGFYLTGGILCAMRRKPTLPAAELCSRSTKLAVLEGVTNPTNVGAIFRSAAALGMDGVLLSPSCTDPLYRRCIRVSMGTVFQIPWAWWPKKEGDALAPGLRAAGYRTVALALEERSVSLQDLHTGRQEKTALLLGNEGYGLKPETIRSCDEVVMIPMKNGVDSLNVAAASAVAFWEMVRDGS